MSDGERRVGFVMEKEDGKTEIISPGAEGSEGEKEVSTYQLFYSIVYKLSSR